MTDYNDDTLGPEGSYYEAKARKEHEISQKRWEAVYPLFITGLYLFLGIFFHLWHPAWLLFLTIPLFYIRTQNSLQKFCNPVMITLIYLILGIFFNLWHPGWLVFLAIPVSAMLEGTNKKTTK